MVVARTVAFIFAPPLLLFSNRGLYLNQGVKP